MCQRSARNPDLTWWRPISPPHEQRPGRTILGCSTPSVHRRRFDLPQPRSEVSRPRRPPNVQRLILRRGAPSRSRSSTTSSTSAKTYSAWAVTTSQGIIIIDTIFDYSVEEQIAGGLKKLGLDPANIKYAVVSHGHLDHFGGAKFLQDRFGARVLMSAADWELIAQSNTRSEKPRRDMVIADGQKLTLGDTTLTFYLTPGHTPGTVSTLIPVKDGGRPHLVAEWGGTGFNFQRSPERFRTYIDSAERFRDLAMKAGADALISNHPNLDGSTTKIPALAMRKPGDPHPYVIGTQAVGGYLTVAAKCATAALEAMK